jgi:cell division septum initiation protein DivIVA
MTEPGLPFDPPLPDSHPRANPPATRTGNWRDYPESIPLPPQEGRILSLECINVLAEAFETSEKALKDIQRAWKDSNRWPERTSGSFNSDWRFPYGSVDWAIWEAKKAGVTCRKLLAEVSEVFPIKTPEEIKAFRLARLRPEAQELKTKLAEREKQARELKESLGELEKSISELENSLPAPVTGQPDSAPPAVPKEKRTRAKGKNPVINNRPLSPEERAARNATAEARRAAMTPEEHEAAHAAALKEAGILSPEERNARRAAAQVRQKERITKLREDLLSGKIDDRHLALAWLTPEERVRAHQARMTLNKNLQKGKPTNDPPVI